MNTYNENLRSSVVASLSSQELDLKNVTALSKASEFNLYYAQGARIIDEEKLTSALDTLEEKAAVNHQAVLNSNISKNLLMSADQGKKYVDLSITNSAVSAANVQVATNAIVRLASDMGAIYSILQAADFDTEIFTLGQEAYNLINTTAYNAEETSQHAMEASSLTAEISASTVADLAKTANASVNTLLKESSTEFDKASEAAATDNANLSKASIQEKTAEGKLESINVAYNASLKAYQISNTELNLGLTSVPAAGGQTFSVSFLPMRTAFHITHPTSIGYPVESYHVMIVKNRSKATFSITMAEHILETNLQDRFVPVPMSVTPPVNQAALEAFLDQRLSVDIDIDAKKDVDGDDLVRGQNYVVFVMGTYYLSFKKSINNFVDFLSAPSASFALTFQLEAPDPTNITHAAPNTTGELSIWHTAQNTHGAGTNTDAADPDHLPHINFSVGATANASFDVEYRCIFLPDTENLTRRLLTSRGLADVEAEVETTEEISERLEPQIVAIESQIVVSKQRETDTQEALNELQKNMKPLKDELKIAQEADNKQEVTRLKRELRPLNTQQNNIKKIIADTTAELAQLEENKARLVQEKTDALTALTQADTPGLGFYFNLMLAEEVIIGNYTTAVPTTEPAPGSTAPILNWSVPIKPETTDNFGSRLIHGNQYIPVILTMPSAQEENTGEYTNAMADFNQIASFTFEDPSLIDSNPMIFNI